MSDEEDEPLDEEPIDEDLAPEDEPSEPEDDDGIPFEFGPREEQEPRRTRTIKPQHAGQFHFGRILAALDKTAYFARALAPNYLHHDTLHPNAAGKRLLKAEYAEMVPGEKFLMRELVRFMKVHHNIDDPRQFSGTFGMQLWRAKQLFVIAKDENIVITREIQLTTGDSPTLEAQREAGLVQMVQSFYNLSMQAFDLVQRDLPSMKPGEQIRVMQAAASIAADLSKGIKGGGRLKTGEMTTPQLQSRLLEMLGMAVAANVQDITDVEVEN